MLYSLLQLIFSIFFKLFFRAEIYGRENMPKDGAVILAANHMSNWDPPLVATFLHRPVSYMAKIELFKNPIFGRAITACHAFPVKRGAADRGAIKAAMQVLKEGRCLGLFPEGTRSRTGKLGTYKIFAGGEHFPKLKVIYGEPMKFEGDHKDKEALEAFSQSIMDKIAAMKAEYQD